MSKKSNNWDFQAFRRKGSIAGYLVWSGISNKIYIEVRGEGGIIKAAVILRLVAVSSRWEESGWKA